MSAEPQPRSVVLLRGWADRLRRHPRAALAGLLGGLAFAWLLTGVHAVRHGDSAVVLRFGRLLAAEVEPGLHFALPRGIDRLIERRTGEVQRAEIQGERGPELPLVTGDENLIEATLVVQYRITRLGDHLFAVADPDELVRQAVRAGFTTAVAGMNVEDVLTIGKAEIQNRVRHDTQELLDRCRAGVSLVAVNLQSVDPPSEAAGAFRAVLDARARAAEAVNQAEGRRDSELRLARGEAAKTTTDAKSTALVRGEHARGAAARFTALSAAARRTPQQTRTDLRLATLRRSLAKARLVVLAPGQKPRVEVNFDERRRAAPAPASLVEPPNPDSGEHP
ncbi:MAG: protease modulator HflK [Thermoanaerobaculia bacterium]|nr:protease modulator HflK [Thermoanaerobaculia bacterium]